MRNIKYPLLEINLEKIASNTKYIVDRCKASGIKVTGVVKGCNAIKEVVKTLVSQGCDSLGSSRMKHLIDIKKMDNNLSTILLRLPMKCEIENLVNHVDISLNSEKETLIEINKYCELLNKNHGVILMIDLGDLREGEFDQEKFVELVMFVEKELKFIKLQGIGTNLSCYGSITPTRDKMLELVDMARKIEKLINRQLDYISGGGTTSLPLVLDNEMPSGVNHLRIGEGILLNKDLPKYFGSINDDLRTNTFILKAQIIEIKEKPSLPIGEMNVDAFGNKPIYEDIGIRKRALLAVGKQDIGDHDKLEPLMDGICIVGSSSDHLIVDITDSKEIFGIGDLIEFSIFYQAMLYLSLSEDVFKTFI